MTDIVKITTHEADALDRLPEQYRDKTKLRALISILGSRAQAIEDAAFPLIGSSAIADAYDAMLDQIGEIVDQKRGGLSDSIYRVRLLAKIAQNISKGTAEDLIWIYKALMGADRVYYNPLYPAGLILTAIGGTPVGTATEIKNATELSHAGGVEIVEFRVAEAVSFSFYDDPDPNGQGFGDATDAEVGGSLATFL